MLFMIPTQRRLSLLFSLLLLLLFLYTTWDTKSTKQAIHSAEGGVYKIQTPAICRKRTGRNYPLKLLKKIPTMSGTHFLWWWKMTADVEAMQVSVNFERPVIQTPARWTRPKPGGPWTRRSCDVIVSSWIRWRGTEGCWQTTAGCWLARWSRPGSRRGCCIPTSVDVWRWNGRWHWRQGHSRSRRSFKVMRILGHGWRSQSRSIFSVTNVFQGYGDSRSWWAFQSHEEHSRSRATLMWFWDFGPGVNWSQNIL